MTSRYPTNLLSFAITADYDRMIYREVDNLWSGEFMMTPEQRDKAHETLKEILREAVSKTLKDFGFKP